MTPNPEGILLTNSRNMIVITTIQDPTPAVDSFAALPDWTTVIVGDKKTPATSWDKRDDLVYLDVDTQHDHFPDLAAALPMNHYSRKNIGYLYAMSQGPELIAESDDDNSPLEGWGTPGPESGRLATITGPRIVNIYRYFTDEQIWPRGYPLDLILKREELSVIRQQQNAVAIEQQLVDGEPDVDAIYRLVDNGAARFEHREPVVLNRGAFAPFNSQNTFWRELAFPFLYLPCTVTFRFTDILRGWVAQRCAWMFGGRLSFTSASVHQDRNPHDLLVDFESEIPVYLQTHDVLNTLEAVGDTDHPGEAVLSCYAALIEKGIVSPDEMPIAEAWVREIDRITPVETVGDAI